MNNKEIAERLVERMLESINSGGKLPWVKPWGICKNKQIIDGYTEVSITPKYWNRYGKPYSGINVMMMSICGKEGEYITFNQCRKEGGKVRKGAKSLPVVYWNMKHIETEELDEDGKKIMKIIPILRCYNVFHISDCEGLKQKHDPKPVIVKYPIYHYEPVAGELELVPDAESIIADYLRRANTLKLNRDLYSDRAFYSPAEDSVTVPMSKQFSDIAEYYSTMFHELGHSTGHSSRLNRQIMNSFGNEKYSREELVAEITAASILCTLGLESGNTFRNSTAYVKSWSEHIKNDPMMFVTASSRAEKAINLIMGIDTIKAEEEEEQVA